VKVNDALSAKAIRACVAIHEALEALHKHEGERQGAKHRAKAESVTVAVQMAKKIGAKVSNADA
jgi:hypothetical protein